MRRASRRRLIRHRGGPQAAARLSAKGFGHFAEPQAEHRRALGSELHHRHAQSFLDLADAARRAQDRHQIWSRQTVLIHQGLDHIASGDASWYQIAARYVKIKSLLVFEDNQSR